LIVVGQPVDFISGLGALPDPQKALEDSLRFRTGLRQANAQAGLLEQKVTEAQREQQRQAQYQQDLAVTLSQPSPQAYSSLFAKYPEFKDAISKSFDTRDAAAKQSDLSQIGQVHAALLSKRPEIAAQVMERTIAARKESGADTAEDEQILAAIKSNDPAAVGLTGAQLAALVGPEKYGQLYEQLNKGKDPFTLAPGSKRYDANGQLIAEAPFAPQYRSVGEGDTLVEVGGGDPVSSGASAGRYTGGWTPRARNGGDNPDDAVDNKIAGVARLLGVDPGADISSLSPKQIAQALAYGEGGSGSLADRNNNPTNLRVPGSAEYRKFGDKDQAIGAAAAQVARNLRRGQTTVRSMIEGLPVGGGGDAANAGGARVVARGAPKPTEMVDQATVDFYADKVAAGGDLPPLGSGKTAAAWRQAILKKAAAIQTGRGISGGESNLAQSDVRANRSALLQAQKTYTSVVGFEDTFQRNLVQVEKLGPKGVGGSTPIFNRWIQSGRKNIQGDPQVSAFNVAVNTAANEYAKLASGGSGGGVTSDSARHEAMEILNNAQTWPQMQAAIRQMRIDGHNRVLAMEKQIGRLRGNISGAGGGNAAAPRAAPPKPGSVVKGYRYKGGNPALPASWVKL